MDLIFIVLEFFLYVIYYIILVGILYYTYIPISWFAKKIFPTKYQGEISIPKILFITCVYLPIMMWILIVSNLSILLENPSLSYRIANYHYTAKTISLVDKLYLGNTKIANKMRINLYNQYKKIRNDFQKDKYNAIGIFNDIDKEYRKIKNKYGNNIDKKFEQLYLNELKINLDEYGQRNKTLYLTALDTSETQDFFIYNIPNRLVFYPQLALSYISYGKFSKKEETVDELTNILNFYETIFHQEKDNHTHVFREFKGARTLKKFNKIYPIFINEYSKAIILITKDIDNENICSKADIFDYYLKSISEYGCKENSEVLNIIKNECKYN